MDQTINTATDEYQTETQKFHQLYVHALLIRKLRCFLGSRTTMTLLFLLIASAVSIPSLVSLFYYRFYSSGHPFRSFPENDAVYFATAVFSPFTHTLERKYMFLLCNGILAFLARTHRFGSSTSDPNPAIDGRKASASAAADGITELPVGPATIEKEEENAEEEIEAEEEKGGGGDEETNDEEAGEDGAGDKDRIMSDSSLLEQADDEGGSEAFLVETDDDDVNEVEGDFSENEEVVSASRSINEELMSTEELNRKVEEFIRKMKEEIRIEAQSQLIAV